MENTKQFSEFYDELKTNDHTENFFESLQCAIVRAGGVFQSHSILMSKTVAELNEILTKYNIAAIAMSPKEE